MSSSADGARPEECSIIGDRALSRNGQFGAAATFSPAQSEMGLQGSEISSSVEQTRTARSAACCWRTGHFCSDQPFHGVSVKHEQCVVGSVGYVGSANPTRKKWLTLFYMGVHRPRRPHRPHKPGVTRGNRVSGVAGWV
jgi:hypothetical protein